MAGMLAVLAEEITLWADGGGKVSGAAAVIHGADAVARFIVGRTERFATPKRTMRPSQTRTSWGTSPKTVDRHAPLARAWR